MLNKKCNGNYLTGVAAVAGGCVTAAVAAAYCVWQNNDIVTTKLVYQNAKVPEAFNGFRIIHVSDLHGKKFGESQSKLLWRIKKEQPDVIAVTGDLINRRNTDLDAVMQFMQGAATLAPVYFIPGNHEARYKNYAKLKEMLNIAGVHVMENSKETFYRDGAVMQIIGVNDPAFGSCSYDNQVNARYMQVNLDNLADGDTSTLHILLTHRPELVDIYRQNKIDLALAGHAHGGQWRVPGVGGLFAPHQGIFPKLTSGMHVFGDTTLIVSRGLGNSGFPIRIANRPELIRITLKNG